MKLKEFIPQKSDEKKPIQGWVGLKTWQKMNELRKKQKITWDELLEALAQFYITQK